MKIQTICLLSLFTILENAHGGNASTKEKINYPQVFNNQNTSSHNESFAKVSIENMPKEDPETIRLRKLENELPQLYDIEAENYFRFCPVIPIKNYEELLIELKKQEEEQNEILRNQKLVKTKQDHAFIQENIAKLKKAIAEVTPKRDEEIRSASASAAASATSTFKMPDYVSNIDSSGTATSARAQDKTDTKIQDMISETSNEPFAPEQSATKKQTDEVISAAAACSANNAKPSDADKIIDQLSEIWQSSNEKPGFNDDMLTKLEDIRHAFAAIVR